MKSKMSPILWFIIITIFLVVACKGITADELILQGWKLNEIESYPEAIEIFDEAISLNSSNPEAWHGKGFALNGMGYEKRDENEFVEARGYFEEAIKCFERAIKLNSSFAFAYIDMADSENNLDNYERALEMSNKAIEIDPKNAEALNAKGTIYYRMGEYDKALELFRKATTIDPKCADGWYNICEVLKEQSRGNPVIAEETDSACQKAAALYNANVAYSSAYS
jgi:tetratricopeptide (TPR) repeat protein